MTEWGLICVTSLQSCTIETSTAHWKGDIIDFEASKKVQLSEARLLRCSFAGCFCVNCFWFWIQVFFGNCLSICAKILKISLEAKKWRVGHACSICYSTCWEEILSLYRHLLLVVDSSQSKFNLVLFSSQKIFPEIR